MATIPGLQGKNQFTQEIIAVVNITPPKSSFGLDKFRKVYKPTLYLSWQVRRWSELLASSIARGTNGNRITATGFTQKIELPPFFHLYFNMMQLDGYNAAFGTQNPAESALWDLQDEAAFMFGEMKEMIRRQKEFMAWQIFQTGIITDSTTGNINFGRNSDSFLDLDSDGYWDTNAGVDPFATMEAMCKFLRQYGKVGGNTFDCIMGANVATAFMKLTVLLERAQKLWNVLTPLQYPKLRDDGSIFLGNVSAGPYSVNLYTYPQYYTASTENQPAITVNTIAGQVSQAGMSNTSTPYLADYNMVMLPSNFEGIHGCALVPQLPKQVSDGDYMGDMGLIDGGEFFGYDYQDVKLTSWENNLKAAGFPILTHVDQVATCKATSA